MIVYRICVEEDVMDGRNYSKIPTRRFPGKYARGIFALLTVAVRARKLPSVVKALGQVKP
jgi:hypothetical protein